MKADELSRKERHRMMDRALITETAARLFSERGFYNVSMSEIAAEAEFSVGTLYNYFKNKDELYETILMDWAGNLMSQNIDILKEDGDVIEILRRYFTIINQFMIKNQAMIRFYLIESRGFGRHSKPTLNENLQHLYEQNHEQLSRLCHRGTEQKIFRKCDPKDMATALIGLFDSFLLDWMSRPDVSPEGIRISQILDFFLDGVKNR